MESLQNTGVYHITKEMKEQLKEALNRKISRSEAI